MTHVESTKEDPTVEEQDESCVDRTPDRLFLVTDRLTRLETLFETHLAHQARREEDKSRRRRDLAKDQRRRDALAAREWRELTIGVRSLASRLDKFEPVILGDETLGHKSLAERLDALERVVLSARVGWRTASFIGTAILGLLSWFAFLMHWNLDGFWPGLSPRN